MRATAISSKTTVILSLNIFTKYSLSLRMLLMLKGPLTQLAQRSNGSSNFFVRKKKRSPPYRSSVVWVCVCVGGCVGVWVCVGVGVCVGVCVCVCVCVY